MKSLLILAIMASTVSAETLDTVVRQRLVVPAGLGIVAVHDATMEVSPETVALEVPSAIRAGRQSIRVYVRGKSKWVPVTFAKLSRVAVAKRSIAQGATITDDDFEIVERPGEGAIDVAGGTATAAIAAGETITHVALPPPMARGTQIAFEVHRGMVTVRGTGTLELDARVGKAATVRLSDGRIVRGTLSPSKVVTLQ